MATTPYPTSGDLFRAEVSGVYVVGKVLWCSPVREHRGAGGFVVLPGVYTDPADAAVGAADYVAAAGYVPATDSVLVIHSSMRILRKRGWPVIGHQDLSPEDEELLLNTRGDTLYREDDFVRLLTPGEAGMYFPWLPAQPGAVDYFLQQIVARQHDSSEA